MFLYKSPEIGGGGGGSCSCNVYSTQQKGNSDFPKSKRGNIWRKLHDNLTFTKASKISLGVLGVESDRLQCLWGPRAQMMDQGLTLSSLPLVQAFHSHSSPRREPRTQAGTHANKQCSLPRLQPPVHGIRLLPGGFTKTPLAFKALVRLSSKAPRD